MLHGKPTRKRKEPSRGATKSKSRTTTTRGDRGLDKHHSRSLGLPKRRRLTDVSRECPCGQHEAAAGGYGGVAGGS